MAETGWQDRRRAVLRAFAGVIVVSTLAGLLGDLTGGAFVLAAQAQTLARRSGGQAHVSQAATAEGNAALLELSDLPSGWVSGATAAAPVRVSPWSASLARCVGVHGSVTSVKPTKVDSPDFTSADRALAVVDSVSVYPSAAVARAAYGAMADTRTTSCMNTIAGPALQTAMQRESARGTTVGNATFASLPSGAAARHVTGFIVTIPLVTAGRQVVVTSTQFDFVQGALLHQVTFNGNGTTFPPELELELLAAAQHRS
jgi:hypothetical protein